MGASNANAVPLGRLNVVCLGNSQTVGFLANNPYPTQLTPFLPPSATVTNSGVNAQTTQNMIDGIAAQATQFYRPSQRNIALVWTGTNDLFFGSTAAQTLSLIATYYGLLKAIGFHVGFIDISPRSQSGLPGDFEANRTIINTAVNVSRPTYCDALYRLSQNPLIGHSGDELNTLYYIDGVHLTDLGLSIVAQGVIPSVLSLAA